MFCSTRCVTTWGGVLQHSVCYNSGPSFPKDADKDMNRRLDVCMHACMHACMSALLLVVVLLGAGCCDDRCGNDQLDVPLCVAKKKISCTSMTAV